MTDLTKADVEALLDGTTEGPFRCETFDVGGNIYAPNGNLLAETYGSLGGKAPANTELFTTAPDLARWGLAQHARAEEAEAAQAAFAERAATVGKTVGDGHYGDEVHDAILRLPSDTGKQALAEWKRLAVAGELIARELAIVEAERDDLRARLAVAEGRMGAVRVDALEIESSGKRWHGEDHRVVSVRWEPYKPDGARQMKAKGRWQEQVGSGDYWRWQNCDRPAALTPAPHADNGEGEPT